MAVRYSTAFSHLVLAGTSCYCLHHVGTKIVGFPQASYGIMAVNSVVGIIVWGYRNHGDSCQRFYRFTTFLQSIFALPCITTSVWLKHNFFMWEVAYAHTFASFIPLIAYLADNNNSGDLVHLIVLVNAVSLGVVAGIQKDWFGVGAAVTYFISHFVIKEEDRDFGGIPALDCFNYGLSLFAFVSARALGAV